jgi:hypothetical protein
MAAAMIDIALGREKAWLVVTARLFAAAGALIDPLNHGAITRHRIMISSL